LNLTTAIKSTKGIFKFETNLVATTLKDEIGKPVRADFVVDLVNIDNNQNFISPNLQNDRARIVSAGGYIDSIPMKVSLDSARTQNNPTGECIRFRPNIVLTTIPVSTPTPGFTLLGLVAGSIMTNKDMYIGVLATKIEGDHNIGNLNILSNLDNNANNIGTALKLSNKQYTQDQVYGVINNLYPLDPVYSIDIESYGPETFYTSMLSAAANGNMKACQDIVDHAVWLTNGAFPKDFDPMSIFVGTPTLVPMGKWHDKNGERDIREIDMAYVASKSNSEELINELAKTYLPKELTGMDPYAGKVEVITKINPEAVITGKALRITFNGAFIDTLSRAVAATGLQIDYNPIAQYIENNTISLMNNYFESAGIHNSASAFARQYNTGGSNWNTPMPQMGAFRYM